ncbi:hypothetical protein [Conexibacter sp. CPCC 206217]|uniref:hypothetical protein n=1 Tax=Conexibacter sp. CPCC 206217 TaxID=3064574 RepID=UPI00272572B6|nr:hypothetical protein [Conexibacter sp. CPCC 206217]MDO8211642.1 hypothetical protein [Conexibacter sp. CPCC 206217]
MGRGTVRIEFVKGETRRYRSLLHRPDGVDVEFEGGSYNKVGGPAGELPHDLAHLIVEDELMLLHGVWGVLVAGGMFRLATVVAGRRAPHATRRGRALVADASERVRQAEVLVRAVCGVCAGEYPADPAALERGIGARWWSDTVTREALARACERLRAAGEQWARLAPGATLEGTWPHAPVRAR